MNKQNLCKCGKPKTLKAKVCQLCYFLIAKGNYKDGRTLKQYFCKTCKKEVGWQTVTEGSGLCGSCSAKRRIGKNNSNYKHGKYIGKKNNKCIECNKPISPTAIRCGICARIGELSSQWNNGSSSEIYPLKFLQERESIRERDGHKCQICGCPETECNSKLHVHHIDYNRENYAKINLISLCSSCHLTTNGNRDYWYSYFTELRLEICKI
jgi:hypothetical protein